MYAYRSYGIQIEPFGTTYSTILIPELLKQFQIKLYMITTPATCNCEYGIHSKFNYPCLHNTCGNLTGPLGWRAMGVRQCSIHAT